jgi:alkanesulfonate monooxygenase SsuD/methylene tetrahydromethanopterin reductase-like flavin-dependent oxidoreductase (luciferase family)
VVALAKTGEAAGFETIAFSDRPPENNLEAWTLATAVACATERIIVTHPTLNVPFGSPGMLAKMAASPDVITGGGRVLLTIGAGGQEGHTLSYSMRFGAPGERVDALIDTIHILCGMWNEASFTYEGKQHSVNEAVLEPKPVNGALPVLIGAGKPRMLKLAGVARRRLDQERRLA